MQHLKLGPQGLSSIATLLPRQTTVIETVTGTDPTTVIATSTLSLSYSSPTLAQPPSNNGGGSGPTSSTSPHSPVLVGMEIVLIDDTCPGPLLFFVLIGIAVVAVSVGVGIWFVILSSLLTFNFRVSFPFTTPRPNPVLLPCTPAPSLLPSYEITTNIIKHMVFLHQQKASFPPRSSISSLKRPHQYHQCFARP